MKATHTVVSLARDDNSLAPFYRAFDVSSRLLFTGHSHQAWPDCAREGVLQCFDDAARHVDEKWELAFEKAERVRASIRTLLGDERALIALGANTHELVVRFLSALPLREKPRLVTTNAEFHSLRRQLDRLEEEGVEIVRVAAEPVATLSERLLAEARRRADTTCAVLVSSVLFTTSEIVPHLDVLGPALLHHGIALLVDAYHHLGVVPFSMRGLEQAAIVGGGYKYLQFGEGNCFLRFPEEPSLRPVITGWYAEFPWLEGERPPRTPYAEGSMRLSGSTYDPTSHYRAARVSEFFAEQGLEIELLRARSLAQTTMIRRRIEALPVNATKLKLATTGASEAFGGFVAVRSNDAHELVAELKKRGVWVDHRNDIVRFGPAPYHSDKQVSAALDALCEVMTPDNSANA